MKRYQLYVHVDGYWELVCGIDAETHMAALEQATKALKPEHSQLPIRLEQTCELPNNVRPTAENVLP
jgi:hypothetical protein